MQTLIEEFLNERELVTKEDYVNVIKEISQHIALLGLWRSNFFQHAAFYGGTCLRIVYGLNRFSEDLDFSLLKPDSNFNIKPYLRAIQDEFRNYGLDMVVAEKTKSQLTTIKSAFIKANTKIQFLNINVPANILNYIPRNEKIKIKFEIDIYPPLGFTTETITLLNPVPFSLRIYQQADLFAGKIHAILCRSWQTRVKGRDWFDFVWYVSKKIPLNVKHLRMRLIDSEHLEKSAAFSYDTVQAMLIEKIDSLDISQVKSDIAPFIEDNSVIKLWSKNFFKELVSKIVLKE